MLLDDKVAIIYGAGGSIGRQVARCFAREGAHLFLAGRTAATLDEVAGLLGGSPRRAQADVLDATDPARVEAHFASVVERAGQLDISFNLVGVQDVQGPPLTAMTAEDFLRPIDLGARSHFLTATAAARHMAERRKGVVMALTATPARLALPLVGGFGPYCAAIEAFYRGLAAEVGPQGVRALWLRSAGSPETFGDDVASDEQDRPAGLGDDAYLERLRRATLLGRFPKAAEVAEAAALAASDRAGAMTAGAVNVTCGQIAD